VLALLLIGGCLVLGAVGLLFASLPDCKLPDLTSPGSGVCIFDRYDRLVTRINGDEDRLPVQLDNISKNMQQAMLAAEDHRFYSHHGVDIIGAGRALFRDVQAGRPVEGASTINEQLVKTLYFKGEPRTFILKLRELCLATIIDLRYSKKKILESYLNEVYFGDGAYGIGRAAQIYFGKEPSQLNVGESAYLAGIVRAPSYYSAAEHRQQAIERQQEVLASMVDSGSISEAQARLAKEHLLRFKAGGGAPLYPYYLSYVMQILKANYGGSDIWHKGLRVYSNLDPQAEAAAQRVLTAVVRKSPAAVTQGALVSVAVPDGAVLALVGGIGDYWSHQWNRATNPHTAGSAFKPFVYLAGLDTQTLNADSTIDDSPIFVPLPNGSTYSPKDFDGKFLGPVSVRKALALSRNVCAVRVAQAAGIGNIIATARSAGITSRLDNNLTLALGSSAVSPLEMAAAYSTLARYGIAIEPRVLRRIEDANGKIIASFEVKQRQVLASETTAELVDAMQDVVNHGTGRAAQLPGRPVAGKTGTSDQSRDTWFVGFTPDIVTAVWCGNDENLPNPGTRVTGGTIAARCWHDYMSDYYQKHPTAPIAFLAPQRPFAPETDFSEEPSSPLGDGQDNPDSEVKSKGNAPEKPGLIKRIFHKIFKWF
jgi:penicillin-binding protein 1A